MFRSSLFDRLLPIAGLLILCAVAVACVEKAGAGVTVAHGPYMLNGIEYLDEESCVAAAKNDLGAEPRECVRKIVVAGTCDDVAGPEPQFFIELDPNPAVYEEPENNKLERWEVMVPEGVQRTFTNVGELVSEQCPNGVDYQLTQRRWVRDDVYPSCWHVESTPMSAVCGA